MLARDKHSSLFSSFVSYKDIEVLRIRSLTRLFTKIVLMEEFYIASTSVTHKYSPKARVLLYTRLERLARDKHYSLFGPFVSYKENEVL
jgi:hypothetical protein